MSIPQSVTSLKTPPKDKKRLARLLAVQALFQADLTGQAARVVLKEFEAHQLTSKDGKPAWSDPDGESQHSQAWQLDLNLMREIVGLALEHKVALEEILAANLPKEWPLDRLERPMRLILLAGLAEIQYKPQTALAVIISDYVDVGHAYLGEREPGMINAILDKAGKALRG